MKRPFHRRVGRRLAQRVDEAFVGAMITPSARTRREDPAEGLDHAERMGWLDLMASFYDQPEHADPSGRFFPGASPVSPRTRRVRRLPGGGEVLDLSWPSDFEPLWSPSTVGEHVRSLAASEPARDADHAHWLSMLERDEPMNVAGRVRERHQRAPHNHTAHARWFRHKASEVGHGVPRPCVMLLHGYMGGFPAVEEQLWPISRLLRGGMDVVLPVLPLHGPRRDRGRGLRPPDFPSSDPRLAVEGFRHMVGDLRTLATFLLDGRVASLGIGGMSLGALGAGLMATLDDHYEFAMMMIPLACIADFAHASGRMVGSPEEQRAQMNGLRAVQRVVSPLARPSRVAPGRTLVIEGRADRVTGPKHAQLLAEHFGAIRSSYPGGHMLQVGRGAGFTPMWSLLEEMQLWDGARAGH